MMRQCFKTEVHLLLLPLEIKEGQRPRLERARYPDENFLLGQRSPTNSLVKFGTKGRGRLGKVYWWHLRRSKSSKRSLHKGVVPYHSLLSVLGSRSQIAVLTPAIFWSVLVTSLCSIFFWHRSILKRNQFFILSIFWSYGLHHKTHCTLVDG